MPNLTLVLLMILVIATTIYGVGVALSVRRTRRARLRDVFARFVERNLHVAASETEIRRFLDDTADVASVFPDGSMARLRLELSEQALRLSRLSLALEENWVGESRRGSIVEGCREKRRWFEQVAGSLNTRFDALDRASLDLVGLCNDGLARFNHYIRA